MKELIKDRFGNQLEDLLTEFSGQAIDSYNAGSCFNMFKANQETKSKILSLLATKIDECKEEIAESIYDWLSITEPNKNILSVQIKSQDILNIIKNKLEGK